MINPILNTDSYKTSHFVQYPPETTRLFAYLESRGGVYDRTLFFGLQAILKQAFDRPVTRRDIDEARELLRDHGVPFNAHGWDLLLRRHQGRLPIEIRALPEGTVVPTHNVMMTVVNTDPDFAWLPSYVETALLRIWYPITVATISWHVRQIIREALVRTADDPEAQLPFKLHDFGARGVSSEESAALGGLAHLVNFKGTDTLSAIVAGRRFYNEPMAGFSIPAAEHSTITSWGRAREVEAYANMIGRFGKPGGIFAVVSDSYDLYAAVDHIWGEQLRQQVIDSGATLVVRPDSGDPVTVVARTMALLAARFGTETNGKGYHVLRHVRVIQGDGVNPASIAAILDRITADGFCASNIAFGMGGALLQKLDRDTQAFAYKASAVEIGGAWHDVYKDPATDSRKRSKRGLLGLVRQGAHWHTVPVDGARFAPLDGGINQLRPVWRDGHLLVDDSLAQVRQRVAEAERGC
ncbi:nicotinate phosphoribosyltransferase [Sphingomonas oleivorans]|uniref:Nicotinamide phosphoribosyltransferase n=1 Tax=Sphingomonas oleivorans TaxID=1735121 RepID=A0A2T5G1J9_9SPHN|nr:nicotinate phosphoribosyltransferase [Sphingomonas oleivorans]PTQ13025.1 nicotinate phosphoribosyltransferase [Sphingomonas oleivorans]